MSVIVCGKRPCFEDLSDLLASSSYPVSKRLRCSSSTSVWISPAPLLEQLRAAFPDMDEQPLEKALHDSGHDLDLAVKSLHELCHGYAEGNSGPAAESTGNAEKGTVVDTAAKLEYLSVPDNFAANGAEWVELFVNEMTNATSMDGARSRAMRMLEIFEKSTAKRAAEKEDILKDQNTKLIRAVVNQHERLKELDEKSKEVQHLTQLVTQYQERLRALEVNNYALTMHLRQAQNGNPIPGRFHPDVF